ncbi:MAG: thiol oxidoreductase [Sphingobacteriales bacterium]|nr:MAG: thiol oxidoreductase [Sphingobacteriales bacterium]
MRKFSVITTIICLTATFSMCRKAVPLSDDDYDERLAGGMATIFDETSKAFSHAVEGMNATDELEHERGDAAFEQTFVSAPAPINSGLGPIFNNVSCISCHHNDGKGTPTAGTVNSSLLFRISGDGTNEFGGPSAVSGYGGQLQDVAIFGKQPECKVQIVYTDNAVTYPDGSKITLRKPAYTIINSYTTLPSHYSLSPRLAPPIFGLGLLENIPESTLLSYADENDADGDGISGRANYVYNTQSKQMEIGRFGLKANMPKIAVQVAGAYQQDMGVTSSIFPQESSWGQPQLDNLKDDPELHDTTLRSVIFYIKSLGVPARRNVTLPEVVAGKKLFTQINCSGCHIPVVRTGVDVTLAAISNQRIQPFTDLLLHDMGSDLADGYIDFKANGKEWRTAPLWGIGLFEKTNGTPYYLHDGRARTIEEAILWHGGEAEKSKNQFMSLTKAERNNLVSFIRSL